MPLVVVLTMFCSYVFKGYIMVNLFIIFGSGLIMILPINVYMLFFNKTCRKSLSLYISSIVIIFIIGLIPWILIVLPWVLSIMS